MRSLSLGLAVAISGCYGVDGQAPAPTPVEHGRWQDVPEIADAIQVSASSDHTCAVLETGEVACWGKGGYGQLGNGELADSDLPVRAVGLSDAVSVAVYGAATCALRTNGEVACWGVGGEGDLGGGRECVSSTGTRTITLTTRAPVPEPIPGIEGAVAISARQPLDEWPGPWSACALLASGEAWCFGGLGRDEDCNPKMPSVLSSDAVAVDRSCALESSGGIVCLGGASTAPGFLDNSMAVALGSRFPLSSGTAGGHSCSLARSGDVWCWGAGNVGQLGDGSKQSSSIPVYMSGVDDAVSVVVNGYHTCALRAGGAVACTGYSTPPPSSVSSRSAASPVSLPGAARSISFSSATGIGLCAALEDGKVTCWVGNESE